MTPAVQTYLSLALGVQVYLAYSKGTGQTDHKVIVHEVGPDRVVQELKVLLKSMPAAALSKSSCKPEGVSWGSW